MWVARTGSESRVKDLLASLAEETRREVGCLQYLVHQGVDDPASFYLYEVYRDADALSVHNQSDHFKRLVLVEAAPLLESRQRQELNLLEI